MGSDKCWSKETKKDKVQIPLSHICNRLSFTSDYYRALVLSSLCVLQPSCLDVGHQGMPLLNVCPPLRGHHQINKINKSNSWQD